LGAIQELRGKYTNIIFISNAEGTGDEDQTLGGEIHKRATRRKAEKEDPSEVMYLVPGEFE